MTEKKTSSGQAADLRKQAEKIARKTMSPENIDKMSPAQIKEMLHELRVHQIELELQNEELRRSQAELDAAGVRFFDFYDLAPVGYFTLSEKGLIIEANLTAAAMLGVVRSEMVRQPLSRFILPGDQNIYYLNRKHIFETNSASPGQECEAQAYELRMIKKDGSIFWVRLDTIAARDTDGAPTCRIVMSNITERKQAESQMEAAIEALQANRRQLTDIIEFLPDATLAIDAEGHVIIWNNAIEEMTGIFAKEMIGKGDYAYTIPFYGEPKPQLIDLVFHEHDEIAAKHPKVIREGDTLIAEVFCSALYNNEGAWVIIKASPLHDQFGKVIGAIASIRDVTERKRVEDSLRESKEQYRAIIDNTTDYIMRFDRVHRHLYANPAALASVGMSLDDIVGKDQRDLGFPAHLCDLWEHNIDKVFTTGVSHSIEFDMNFVNGKTVHIQMTLSPEFNIDGSVNSVIGLSRDITDQ